MLGGDHVEITGSPSLLTHQIQIFRNLPTIVAYRSDRWFQTLINNIRSVCFDFGILVYKSYRWDIKSHPVDYVLGMKDRTDILRTIFHCKIRSLNMSVSQHAKHK